ncbi:MAG: hypothetical protein FWH35_04470 [Treponema sp.]|nr:hypothetical protein [Treponema sp.]
MLKKKKLKALPCKAVTAVLAAVLLMFTLVGCGSNGAADDDDLQSVTYKGTAGGVTYTLTITENAARYTPQIGDSYELTRSSDTKKSTGTVSGVGAILTLQPSESGASKFTVTVSGANISAMSGTIAWDGGSTDPAPAALTPSGGNDDKPDSPNTPMGGRITIKGLPLTDLGMSLNNYYTTLYVYEWDGTNLTNQAQYWEVVVPLGTLPIAEEKGSIKAELIPLKNGTNPDDFTRTGIFFVQIGAYNPATDKSETKLKTAVQFTNGVGDTINWADMTWLNALPVFPE